jgi:SAM-dependent methyltransferase
MSHPEQRNFVKSIKDKFLDFFNNKKVIEIGSLNINGSIRSFFKDCEYLGVDVGEGKNVDLVCEGQKLDHPNDFYDVSASCECFEHNPYWLETFINMHRMTKKNGLVFFTCATTGRKEHGTTKSNKDASPLTTWEYYKNLTSSDFELSVDLKSMFSFYEFKINEASHDLYFYGFKK